MECGGTTPLWLGVGVVSVCGHGLAENALPGRRLGDAAVSGHEPWKSKHPRSQSGVMPPHSTSLPPH